MKYRPGQKGSSPFRSNLGQCIGGILILWALAFCYLVMSTGMFAKSPVVPVIEEWEASLDSYLSRHQGLHYGDGGVRRTIVEEGPYFKLGNLLSTWNPDDTAERMWEHSPAHPGKGQGLPRFDFMNESEVLMARAYELASLPFVFHNIPDLDNAAQTAFSSLGLQTHFGKTTRKVEMSKDNHFTYYHKGGASRDFPDWTPPQTDVHMNLASFMKLADEAGKQNLLNTANLRSLKSPLHYMTINAEEGKNTPWIVGALPFFDVNKYKPTSDSHFSFIKDAQSYHGVNCRFGMRGVVASAHFDSKDNFIAMVRGRKRYIVLPPSECDKLDLLPKNHPSGRHSKVDWSSPVSVSSHATLKGAHATEVVLRMGEMLFLPAFWFHYIVSQDASIQCNCRSGPSDAPDDITQCMQRVKEAEAIESAPLQTTSSEAAAPESVLVADREHDLQNQANEASSSTSSHNSGNSQADAAAILDSMAHGQGLDLHPDRHFRSGGSGSGSGSGTSRGPRTRRNVFGSEQSHLHMDSGADLRLSSIMKFGEE